MILMIKCIIFDMGGVILTKSIEPILTEIAQELKIPVDFLMQFRKAHKEELWDGKLSVSDIALAVKKEFSLSLAVDEILAVWEKTYLKINALDKGALDLVKKLKKNYKVALISNLWDFHVQINRKRKLYDYFDPCVLSCKIGIHKPQKEIFELAIKKAKVKGEECVFIDDRAEYFSVAQSLGMKTIEFKNVKKLVVDLKALGVVIG